jgi:hypothetical protein
MAMIFSGPAFKTGLPNEVVEMERGETALKGEY